MHLFALNIAVKDILDFDAEAIVGTSTFAYITAVLHALKISIELVAQAVDLLLGHLNFVRIALQSSLLSHFANLGPRLFSLIHCSAFENVKLFGMECAILVIGIGLRLG